MSDFMLNIATSYSAAKAADAEYAGSVVANANRVAAELEAIQARLLAGGSSTSGAQRDIAAVGAGASKAIDTAVGSGAITAQQAERYKAALESQLRGADALAPGIAAKAEQFALAKSAAASEAEALATTAAATAQNVRAARLAQAEGADTEYVASLVRAAEAQNLRAEKVARAETGDADYIASVVKGAEAQNLRSAKLAQAEAADTDYVDSVVASAAAQSRLAVEVSKASAASAEFVAATTAAALTQEKTAAAQGQHTAFARANLPAAEISSIALDQQGAKELNGVYQQRLRLAVLGLAEQAGEVPSETAIRITAVERLQAEKESLAAVSARRAAIQAGGTAEAAEVGVIAARKAEEVLLNAAVQQRLAEARAATGATDVAALAALQVSTKELATVADQRLALARLGLPEMEGETAAQTAIRIAVTERLTAETLSLAAAQARRTALAAGGTVEADEVALIAQRKAEETLLNATIDQRLAAARAAASADDVAALAALQASTKELTVKADQRLALSRLSLPIIEGEAAEQTAIRITAAERLAAEKQTLAAVRSRRDALADSASMESEEAALIAQRRVEEKRLNQEINRRTQAEINARVDAGDIPAGTRWQQLQAGLASIPARGAQVQGPPRLPEEFARLGQTLQSRFATTASFAVSGAATYGAYTAFKDILKSEQDVQTAFVALDGQMTQLGENAGIPKLHSQIGGIATATGLAEAAVATAFPRIRGIFDTTADAVANAKVAAETAKVTGVTIATLVDQLAPAAKSWKASFQDVTDVAFALQPMGIAAAKTIEFVGAIAPVAKQAGLSIKEVGALAVSSLLDQSRSAGSVAEDFNRILPAIQKNKTAIGFDLASNPTAQRQYGEDVAAGKTGAAIGVVLAAYKDLKVAQQERIAADFGSQRTAKDVTALLQDSAVYIKALAAAQTSAGQTSKYFSDYTHTLAGELSKLSEAALQAGRAFLQSGIASGFAGLLHEMTSVANAAKDVGNMFEWLNSHSGHLGTTVLEIVVAVKALQIAMASLEGGKLGTLLTSLPGIGPKLGGLGGISAQTKELGGPEAAAKIQLDTAGEVRQIQLDTAAEVREVLLGGASEAVATTQVGTEAEVAAREAEVAAEIAARQAGAAAEIAAREAGGVATSPIGVGAPISPLTIAVVAAIVAKTVSDHISAAGDRNVKSVVVSLGTQSDQQVQAKTSDKSYAGGWEGELSAEARNAPGFTSGQKRITGDLADVLSVGSRPAAQFLVGRADPSTVASQAQKQLSERFATAQADTIAALVTANVMTPAEQKRFDDDLKKGTKKGFDEAQKILRAAQTKPGSAAALAAEAAGTNTLTPQSDPATIQKADQLRKAGADLATAQAGADPLAAARIAADLAQADLTAAQGVGEDVLIGQATAAKAKADQAYVVAMQNDHNSWTALAKTTATARGDRLGAAQDDVDLITQEITDAIKNNAGVGAVNALLGQQAAAVEALRAQTQADNLALAVSVDNLAKAKATAAGDTAAADAANVAALQKNLTDAQATANLHPDDKAAAAKVNDAQAALTAGLDQQAKDAQAGPLAWIDLQTALDTASGNGVAAAKDALTKANQAVDNAKPGVEKLNAIAAQVAATRGVQVAVDAQNAAGFDVVLAQDAASGDTVKAALDGLAKAKQAASTAVGYVAQQQTAAAVITADRTARDAVQALADGNVSVVLAMANAAGDTVKAADIALQAAQDKRARDLAASGGVETPGTKADLADVISKQAADRDAKLQNQLSFIDFQASMGQITVGQEIAQINAMIAAGGLTNKEIQDLQLRVHGLLQQAGQNLAFNLSGITLPTLYEVHRTNQTPTGSTYTPVDQRQMNFYFNVNGATLNQVQTVVASAIGQGPLVHGSGLPAY